jgi:hypothetical protein
MNRSRAANVSRSSDDDMQPSDRIVERAFELVQQMTAEQRRYGPSMRVLAAFRGDARSSFEPQNGLCAVDGLRRYSLPLDLVRHKPQRSCRR